MPDWPKAVGRVPVKALLDMFMARNAGKKLVPLAEEPDTLLGSGPLHVHTTSQRLSPILGTFTTSPPEFTSSQATTVRAKSIAHTIPLLHAM